MDIASDTEEEDLSYDECELFGSAQSPAVDFYAAAIDGDVVEMKRLIKNNVMDIDHLSPYLRSKRILPDALPAGVLGSHSALFLAALHGHAEVVQLLLSNKASAAAESASGLTALHAAVFHNETAIVDLLLRARAPLWPIRRNVSPLQLAAYQGHLRSVAALLAAGAPINIGVSAHFLTSGSPLQLAAANGHLSVVEALIANTRPARAPEWAPDEDPGPNRVLVGIGSAGCHSAPGLAEQKGHVAVAAFLEYPTYKKWLWRRLWRRCARVAGVTLAWHARAVERLYSPGGSGYEAARADFEGRLSKQHRVG